MQALTRSGATATGSGGASAQSSAASAQRGTNAHPGSGVTGLGTEPASAASRAVARGVQREPRPQQAVRVRVRGRAEHRGGRADLGDPAGVQHGDAVGDLRGDAEVVGDQHDAAADLVAQPLQQAQHLGLHGDVERRRRLVGDDQLRVARDRDRDHHALPQSAGEFVRVGPHPPLRLGDADGGQQAQRLLVAAGRLGDLLADPHRGVQRGHRVLEDRAEVEPADLAQRLGVAVDHVRARDAHGAVDLGAPWAAGRAG